MSQVVTYNGVVGYVIEQRRIECGMDQTQVAAAAGMSQPVLSRLEKGKASITIDQLFSLATALQTTPDVLIRDAQNCITAFQHDKHVEVLTSKQTDSVSKSGSQTKAVLAGAAIGAVLGVLLSRK